MEIPYSTSFHLIIHMILKTETLLHFDYLLLMHKSIDRIGNNERNINFSEYDLFRCLFIARFASLDYSI